MKKGVEEGVKRVGGEGNEERGGGTSDIFLYLHICIFEFVGISLNALSACTCVRSYSESLFPCTCVSLSHSFLVLA